MALVSYSDSEGSDTEAPAAPPAPKPVSTKPAVPFQKSEARKIKVDLPTVKPEPGRKGEDGANQPPAKRARTAGAFGGFNSLLPAPKRAAQQTGLKKGVSLKTSSEAAFSRSAPAPADQNGENEYDEYGNRVDGTAPQAESVEQVAHSSARKAEEPDVKIVGKATKFKPLSVANNKKTKVAKKAVVAPVKEQPVEAIARTEEATVSTSASEPAIPPPKVKRSLFSVQQDEADLPPDLEAEADSYSTLAGSNQAPPPENTHISQPSTIADSTAPSVNSLEAVASDLNLTAAQRRQLFGRSKGANANVRHFDLESEYATNQQLAQNGETFEHRAVKAVAPGKHSLQQLVNNARTNQDSIEDKWAEGRRNRGDAGSRYGW